MKKRSYSELNYFVSENEFCKYSNKIKLEKIEDIKSEHLEVLRLTKEIKIDLEKNTENQEKYFKNAKSLKKIKKKLEKNIIEIDDEEEHEEKVNNFKKCSGIKSKIQLVGENNHEKGELNDTVAKLYSKTVDQLRKECKSLNIPTGGLKSDLIARISTIYASQSSPYFSKKSTHQFLLLLPFFYLFNIFSFRRSNSNTKGSE